MSESCLKEAATTTIFSHGSDSTDSDFIQEHIDSFFPPADSEVVIEEDRENRSDYRIDYVVDLVDDAVDMLVAGFAYVRDLVQTVGEMIVEWGMRVIDAIGQAFSAVRDAVNEVGELMSALADWIVSHVSSLFSSVWNTVISGLESWAEGIQEAMEDFFEELAEWDEMDGSESMEDTMEAGSALMLSFIGQQDRASSVMDVMERIMRFIEPFQEYISLQGVIEVISGASDFGGYFNQVKDLVSDGISEVIGQFMSIVFGQDGYLGIVGVWDKIEEAGGISGPIFSIDALINFLDAAGLYSGLTKTLVEAAESFLDGMNSEMIMSGIGSIIAMVIPIATTLTSLIVSLGSGTISFFNLGMGAISLILSTLTEVIGNILFTTISCISGMYLSFLGMVFSGGEPVQLGIGLFEFFGAPWFFLLGFL